MGSRDRQKVVDMCAPECPICLERMDETDLALLPCPCDFQVCLWCLRRLRQEENNKCPQCRREYDEALFRRAPISVVRKAREAAAAEEERLRALEGESARSSTNGGTGPARSADDDPEASLPRGYRHPLVCRLYNCPPHLLNAQTLSSFQYLGKYGRLISIVVAAVKPSPERNTAFVSFARTDNTTFAQQKLPGLIASDIAKYAANATEPGARLMRFQLGAAHHCIQTLRGVPCTNDRCTFIHCTVDKSPKYCWKATRKALNGRCIHLPESLIAEAVNNPCVESLFGKTAAGLLQMNIELPPGTYAGDQQAELRGSMEVANAAASSDEDVSSVPRRQWVVPQQPAPPATVEEDQAFPALTRPTTSQPSSKLDDKKQARKPASAAAVSTEESSSSPTISAAPPPPVGDSSSESAPPPTIHLHFIPPPPQLDSSPPTPPPPKIKSISHVAVSPPPFLETRTLPPEPPASPSVLQPEAKIGCQKKGMTVFLPPPDLVAPRPSSPPKSTTIDPSTSWTPRPPVPTSTDTSWTRDAWTHILGAWEGSGNEHESFFPNEPEPSVYELKTSSQSQYLTQFAPQPSFTDPRGDVGMYSRRPRPPPEPSHDYNGQQHISEASAEAVRRIDHILNGRGAGLRYDLLQAVAMAARSPQNRSCAPHQYQATQQAPRPPPAPSVLDQLTRISADLRARAQQHQQQQQQPAPQPQQQPQRIPMLHQWQNSSSSGTFEVPRGPNVMGRHTPPPAVRPQPSHHLYPVGESQQDWGIPRVPSRQQQSPPEADAFAFLRAVIPNATINFESRGSQQAGPKKRDHQQQLIFD